MRRVLTILVFTFLSACGQDLKIRVEKLEEDNRILKEMAGPLPASLDNYYPPKAPAPVYLIDMFDLSTPLDGIGVDLQENDIAGARANFDAFKSQYEKMAGMIEEWKDKFPMEIVNTLDQALKEGDPASVGKAMDQIGSVCFSCHVISQVKAQQKYHWPVYDTLTLSDPVSGEKLSWHEYMMRMTGTYSGINTSLKQGQLENARRNFKLFSNRFSSMTEGCFDCHYTPRSYYTDSSVQDIIKELGTALDAPVPDENTIRELSLAIGNEGCLKCHYVHMPAVLARQQWKNYQEIFNEP